jgi:uncharacterized protein (DUF433 family)
MIFDGLQNPSFRERAFARRFSRTCQKYILSDNETMNSLLERITIQPDICHGKPVIRGLRYPVESVLEYLAAGDSFETVLAEFHDLEREDLLACLEFAARSLKVKSQHLVLT